MKGKTEGTSSISVRIGASVWTEGWLKVDPLSSSPSNDGTQNGQGKDRSQNNGRGCQHQRGWRDVEESWKTGNQKGSGETNRAKSGKMALCGGGASTLLGSRSGRRIGGEGRFGHERERHLLITDLIRE